MNFTNFNGTYILDNLTPYTEYSVYVTAVRLIGDTGRPLEGMKTTILIKTTLAGSKSKNFLSQITGVNLSKPYAIIILSRIMAQALISLQQLFH